jgi:hypothetical protein|tara:strand:+ start:276 stop:443 length:168 start_codon:yes stop_codon:yes gene_type:complete
MVAKLIGGILIALGALDFILGNFAGINLTYFLGAASSFAPIALVLVGGAIMKMSD